MKLENKKRWPRLDFGVLKKDIDYSDIRDFIERNKVLEDCFGYHNSSQIEKAKDELGGKGELRYKYVNGKEKLIL